jgi:hypothetical protein
MTLENIQTFSVPSEIVEDTEESLVAAGSEGFERFVLWSGNISGDDFLVETVHVPEQEAYKLDTGLLVRIEGEALHRLNTWLYESGEVLGVQVHAHPTLAYHSETDDTYPIVTTLGGLSIVTPDFCTRGLFAEDSAVFRLTREGWLNEKSSLVKVI